MGNAHSSHNPGSTFESRTPISNRSLESLRVLEESDILLNTPGAQYRLQPEIQRTLKDRLFEASEDDTGAHPNNTLGIAMPTGTLKDGLMDPRSPTSTVNVGTAIAILNELKKSATTEDLRILQQILQAPEETSRSVDPQKATPVEEKAPRMPRRRSFFSPAARNGSANVLKKTASRQGAAQGKSQHQTWSPEMFGDSPLAKIVGLGEIDRAGTPADPDISYLGGHKLGSLQVMNGAASPEPSIRSSSPVRSPALVVRDEEYFTASEGGRDSPTKTPNVAQTSYADNLHQDIYTANSPAASFVDEATLQPRSRSPVVPPSPPRSPLNGPRRQPLSRKETNASISSTSSSIIQKSPSQQMYQTEAKSNPFLPSTYENYDADCSRKSSQTSAYSKPSSTGCPSMLKTYYRADGNTNPFLPATDDEDDGEVLTEQPKAIPALACDVPSLPNVLPRPSLDDDDQSVYSEHYSQLEKKRSLRYQRTVSYDSAGSYYRMADEHNDSDVLANRSDSSGKRQRPRLKTDSGYGSEASTYTLYENSMLEREQSEPFSNHAQPVNNDMGIRETAGDWNSAQARQAHRDMITNPSTNATPERFPPLSVSTSFARDKDLPPSPKKSTGFYLNASKSASSPDLTMSLNDSSPGTPTTNSATTTPKKSPNRKKLQKKRGPPPGAVKLPLVVPSPKGFSGIPTVPAETLTKHSARMNQNPGMDHLERTYKSVSHDSPNVPESEHAKAVEIKFPSPSASPRPGKRSSLGLPNGIRIFSGKPRHNVQDFVDEREPHPEDPQIAVADFGNVAGYLGNSPYDIASAANVPRSQHFPSRGPTYPHQMSGGHGRSKRLVGMDEEQASAFALRRSRDRVANQGNPALTGFYACPGDSLEALSTREPRNGNPPSVLSRPASDDIHPAYRYGTQNQHDDGWRGGYHMQKPPLRLPPRLRQISKDDISMPDSRPPDWEAQKRAWRTRRKSIGEGLAQSRPTWDEQQGGEAPPLQRIDGHTFARPARKQVPSKSMGMVTGRPGPSSGQELRLPPSGRPELTRPAAVPRVTPVSAFLKQHIEFSVPQQNIARKAAPPPPPRSPSPAILARVAMFDRPHQMALRGGPM